MRIVPCTLREANDLVARMHRHHRPVRGCRFTVGLEAGGQLVGAAIVGRPIARAVDQTRIAEVSRLVTDGTPNACSMLYGAAARAAKALGYDAIQTYILASEPGTSLRAAGWIPDGEVRGRSWKASGDERDQAALLPFTDAGPTEAKRRWVLRFRSEPIKTRYPDMAASPVAVQWVDA